MSTIYFVETAAGEQKDLLCRWTEHLYSQGKRVRIVVDSIAAAQLIDQLLWTFSQPAFVPHAILNQGAPLPEEPVVITPGQFQAGAFNALVCDCQADLEFMGQFETAVHFIPGDDLERKEQSRDLWKRARGSGLNPVHIPHGQKL